MTAAPAQASVVDDLSDLPSRSGRGRPPARLVVQFVALAIAAIPVVRMTLLVRSGTHMPWGDYWMMVDTIVADDGSTRWAGFLEFQNEHPVVLAKVLFWLNLKVFDGSNIMLGYVVVLAVVAQAALVWHLLRRTNASTAERCSAIVLTTILLFSMNGSWNFYKSMSGAAWLTANLFAVVAVALRQHDRTWMAAGAAVLSTISYGTGLSTWVALVAVGLVRRKTRQWWRELPLLVALAVGYWWYRSSTVSTTSFVPDTRQVAESSLTLFMAPLHIDTVGFALVAAVLATGLGAAAIVRHDLDAAPWLGLATYGAASSASIAYGRWWSLGDDPVSRYHSLAAYFWIGTTVLVAMALRRLVVRTAPWSGPVPVRIGVAAAALVVIAPMVAMGRFTTTAETVEMKQQSARQDLGAAALRMGVGEDMRYMFVFGQFDGDVGELRRVGQYPFSTRWNEDCGMLGHEIDTARLPRADHGIIKGTRHPLLPGSVLLTAAVPDLDAIRCILALSETGEVVGVGVVDDTANYGFFPDGTHGSMLVADDGHRSYRIVMSTRDEPDGILLASSLGAGDMTDG